jgi:carboxyl-terminal processing protease
LNEQGSGKFIGVGIQVGTKDGSIIVIAPIDGGPAKEAGIQSGDIIYMVDDKIYADKDIDAAVTYMRGEAGKPVTITVKRGTEELAFTIIRREITVAPIKSEILPDNMGLITLTQFTKDSDQLFVNALDDLKAQGARGYIIDLRGNPGGYLDESINIASNFIERGKVVVSTIDKHGKKIEDVSKGGNYIGVPLVVLIDEGSASASEVVAGALRDYNAAELVGVKSFGKGIVQQVMELPGGEGLKLTVAAYYSPNGTNIHKIGIEPDIAVELPEDLTGANYTRELDTQLQTAIEELSKRMAQ